MLSFSQLSNLVYGTFVLPVKSIVSSIMLDLRLKVLAWSIDIRFSH